MSKSCNLAAKSVVVLLPSRHALLDLTIAMVTYVTKERLNEVFTIVIANLDVSFLWLLLLQVSCPHIIRVIYMYLNIRGHF